MHSQERWSCISSPSENNGPSDFFNEGDDSIFVCIYVSSLKILKENINVSFL